MSTVVGSRIVEVDRHRADSTGVGARHRSVASAPDLAFRESARAENRPDSDWDLLAIVPDCPEPADFDDPMTVWQVKREPGVSSDLVVYRRSDFDEDQSVPNTLAYSTRLDGVLVYER